MKSFALLMAVAAANRCASLNDCSSCAAPPEDGEVPCFWCYDSSECLEVHGILKPMHGCQAFTFNSDDCACEPKERTSCAACAEVGHLGCVWATVETNLTMRALGQVASIPVASRTACQSGNGIDGPGRRVHNHSWTALGQTFAIGLVTAPTRWYWLQCEVEGVLFAGLVSGLSAVALCIACVATRCVLSRVCKRSGSMQRQELLDEAAGGGPTLRNNVEPPDRAL